MFSHYIDFHNSSYVQTFSMWTLGDFQSFLHFLKYNAIYKLVSKKTHSEVLCSDKFAKYSHILKWWYLVTPIQSDQLVLLPCKNPKYKTSHL